jgi:hypothetical protein
MAGCIGGSFVVGDPSVDVQATYGRLPGDPSGG